MAVFNFQLACVLCLLDPAGQEQGWVLSFELHQPEIQAEIPPWHLGNCPARARNICQQLERQVVRCWKGATAASARPAKSRTWPPEAL